MRQANRYMYVGGDPVNLADPSGLTHNDYGSARRRPTRASAREKAVIGVLTCAAVGTTPVGAYVATTACAAGFAYYLTE